MITYNDLYESARKERYSDQLQTLPKNFISEVAEYLREKKELVSKEDDMFSDMIMKTKKQLENATTIFKELMTRRKKKILDLVLIAAETGISKQDFDNMLSFERTFFEELMKNVEISDKNLAELLSNKKEEKTKNDLVVFKSDVGEFLDLEGNKAGPFTKGEIANISKDIAKILVEDGKADFMEK